MLTRLTIKHVYALLKDGNYTRAAELAVELAKDDPLVAMLARELAAVGNKNRNGRGPRMSDNVKVLIDGKWVDGMTPHELCAAMLYDDLILARKIVDGKTPNATVGATNIADEKSARALLRKYKLDKVEKWQQFPAQARTVAANKYDVAEEKIPR